ncbi:hypothetical protein [Devosia sp. CAU 1758]
MPKLKNVAASVTLILCLFIGGTVAGQSVILDGDGQGHIGGTGDTGGENDTGTMTPAPGLGGTMGPGPSPGDMIGPAPLSGDAVSQNIGGNPSYPGSTGGNPSYSGSTGGNLGRPGDTLPGFYGDSGDDRESRVFGTNLSDLTVTARQYLTLLSSVTLALFILCPTLAGVLFLFGAFAMSAQLDHLWPKSLRTPKDGFFSEPKETDAEFPKWISMVESTFGRLCEERAALIRKFRLLFGLGLFAVGLSAATLSSLIERSAGQNSSGGLESLALISPMVLFQLLAGYLIRQAFLVQSEIATVRQELNLLQLRTSIGLTAETSGKSLSELLSEFTEDVTKEADGKSNDNPDAGTAIDIKSLAALLTALFRQPG